MSESIYTYETHERLSKILGTFPCYDVSLSDQELKKIVNIDHDGTIIPWNKGKTGVQTAWCKGKKIGPNKKLSEYRSGKSYDELYGSETAKNLKNKRSEQNSGSGNPMWGKSHKESTKRMIGEKATGRKTGRTSLDFTPEWKDNISESCRNQELHTCPKCGKTMSAGNYVRWGHGDGCKKIMKKNNL